MRSEWRRRPGKREKLAKSAWGGILCLLMQSLAPTVARRAKRELASSATLENTSIETFIPAFTVLTLSYLFILLSFYLPFFYLCHLTKNHISLLITCSSSFILMKMVIFFCKGRTLGTAEHHRSPVPSPLNHSCLNKCSYTVVLSCIVQERPTFELCHQQTHFRLIILLFRYCNIEFIWLWIFNFPTNILVQNIYYVVNEVQCLTLKI